MSADSERSEAVIEDFKKRKLARSALRRIREVIYGFEQDRAADVRVARIGITIILVMLGLAAYLFFGSDSLTLG